MTIHALPWVLIALLLILAVGFACSYAATHRYALKETSSPADYGLPFEEVAFPTSDGLQLAGVWIPAKGSRRAVAILHGHGGSLDYDLRRAPHFWKAGFNVLLFDFRAHGRSPGRIASFGCLERHDVLGAVAYMKRRGMQRIGLLGFSYGGMAAVLAAPLSGDIHAVISDGGPVKLRSAITGRLQEWHLPRWLAVLLAWLVQIFTSVRLGMNLAQYEPVRWIGRIAPRPLLLIHGERDPYLPDFELLADAAGPSAEIWRLAEAGHCQASELHPQAYYRRVLSFFKEHLG